MRYSPEINRTRVLIKRIQPWKSSNMCRGVSHTPWCERKRKKRTTQSSPNFNRTSVGAYRIRPDVGENETMAANTSPSSAVYLRPWEGVCDTPLQFCVVNEMTQNRLEPTSNPICSLRKTIFTSFNTLLYTCKTSMQTFKNLLFTTQNRHANVQSPFVPCVKPLCKCSGPHCSWYKTIYPFYPYISALMD